MQVLHYQGITKTLVFKDDEEKRVYIRALSYAVAQAEKDLDVSWSEFKIISRNCLVALLNSLED